MLRVAVVTPYHTESDAVLMQCHESVRRQTITCDHILIADGHPNALFDASPRTLHVRLPASNDDNGNTPRAIGGMLARQRGFDAIVYLDADNWFESNHIELMLAGHRSRGDAFVACKRVFCDLDGRPLPITEHEEEVHRHVDTSCWMILRPAFAVLTAWLMPRVLSPVCDRIFFHAVLNTGLPITAAACRTVHFRTKYGLHYEAAGRSAPPGSKAIAESVAAANAYLASARGAAAFTQELDFTLPRL